MDGLLFDNSEWCDICSAVIPNADVKNMYIEGCEKTLCKSCRGEMELKLKVVETNVIQDMLKLLIKGYGMDKVRNFDLMKAERYAEEKELAFVIEKRGGKFNQEKLGEFVSLSTSEIARIVAPGAKVICFGWNSNGMGKQRGGTLSRMLIVAHGGNHNDTICTVWVKN